MPTTLEIPTQSANTTANKPSNDQGHAMQFMEIWGGNEAIETALSTPGLDVWVSSQPYEQDQYGGDIYYASMCGAGHIARFALADVAGHGSSVAGLAHRLRKMMRKNINTLDQTQFANTLNNAFTELSGQDQHGKFATAVLTTYFAPTDHLVIVNAGHPRPLWYESATQRWHLLDPNQLQCLNRMSDAKTIGAKNLPLGIIDSLEYEQFATPLGPGDLVVIYTDAFIEAKSPAGEMLGEQGLLDLVKCLCLNNTNDPSVLSQAILKAIDDHRGGSAPDDDQTLIVMHHNAANPPAQSISDKFTIMAKVLGLKKI